MTDTATPDVLDEITPFTDEADREIAYRSEAAPSSATPGSRPAVVAATAATGRRKEAIARVRLAPGSGKFSINGRSLEEYFPNKLHQQTINEPFVTAAVEGSYDVIAKIIGGGVKGGMTYGATDEFGFRAVEDRVHVHDLHATILHLLGLDHERLTYRYSGRDFRLTDVAAR